MTPVSILVLDAPIDSLLETDITMLNNDDYLPLGVWSGELSSCISGPGGITQGAKCYEKRIEVCSLG